MRLICRLHYRLQWKTSGRMKKFANLLVLVITPTIRLSAAFSQEVLGFPFGPINGDNQMVLSQNEVCNFQKLVSERNVGEV